MSGRLSYQPYDVAGASASVYGPTEPGYIEGLENAGVCGEVLQEARQRYPDGFTVVGIGADYPDIVLYGDPDDLAWVAEEILRRLGRR